jgi:hypothetical protein
MRSPGYSPFIARRDRSTPETVPGFSAATVLRGRPRRAEKNTPGPTIRTGAGPNSQFVRLIAYSSIVIGQLEELAEGDALAVKGELKVAAYLDKAGEPKPSIDGVADGLVALEKPSGRKKAASPKDEAAKHRAPFDDAVPF